NNNNNNNCSIEFLQQPLMINFLYSQIFIPPPSGKTNTSYLDQLIYLLSIVIHHNNIENVDNDINIIIKSFKDVSSICSNKQYNIEISENKSNINKLYKYLKYDYISKGILIWIHHSVIKNIN